VRDLEQQQEEADGRGLLQFEAEQPRNNEELLSSKELAFANPPRISPGSYTTPPAFLGGREEQLTRPSAPWTHSSRTRDFAYEQEKMQGNDEGPSPGSTYWLSLYVVVAGRGGQLTRPSAPWTHSSRTRDFAYEQEKMRGNDRRPPPGSTYWLSLYVVVAARRSSSTL
jgi:hypothetical protein